MLLLQIRQNILKDKNISVPSLRGEEWDGTHFARLIEDFCEVRNKKSNEWTAQVLSGARAERRGNPGFIPHTP